ncbi:MAG: glycosyltransferase family 2 protein [Deltaproteobacteria bacterium]|nr:glycosyltransferase family 2 protein [Deltaproteobacteria bacterium]
MQQSASQLNLKNVTPDSKHAVPSRNFHKIAIVIPCFNEASNISLLGYRLKGVRKILSDYENVFIIFVDDGSTDMTLTEMESAFAQVDDFHVVRHWKNMGFSQALRSGIDKALELGAELIVTIDADTNYDHFFIPMFVEMFPQECDLITASPWHPLGQRKFFPKSRLILSLGLSCLYRWALRRYQQPLYTYSACFRVAKAEVYKKIRWEEPAFMATSEILTRCIINGLKVKEIPFQVNPRWFGMSKMQKVRHIVLHLKFLYKVWRNPNSFLIKTTDHNVP